MVRILDTTLREGEQTPGVYFAPHVKMAIAGLLSRLGVDVVEAGHPAVSPADAGAVRLVAGSGIRATVGAHARLRREDVDVALDTGARFLGVFFSVAGDRLRDQSLTLAAALERIAGVVGHARARDPRLTIRYTPEDAARTRVDSVLEAAAAASAAGADVISVADTTGCLVPGTAANMHDLVGRLREGLARRGLFPEIAVHCHNDRGLALANALDGLRAGATVIDASVLGLGERAGIVDLATLLAVLAFDFNQRDRWDLALLPDLYEQVGRHAALPVPAVFPVTGRYAFTHCAGVHAHAVLRDPARYQSLPPEPFGRRVEIALGHMAGMAALQHKLREIGVCLSPVMAQRVLERVKAAGGSGRTIDLPELAWIVAMVQADSASAVTPHSAQ